MLDNIISILIIIISIIVLFNVIYVTVSIIKEERDFNEFKKRQFKTLEALENDIKKRKGDK